MICEDSSIFALGCHSNARGLQTKSLERVYKRRVGLARGRFFAFGALLLSSDFRENKPDYFAIYDL